MATTFTDEFFRGNRQRLRALVDADTPIVLTAHGLLQRSSDNTYPFQQDSSFWYLTGVEEPDVLLVMTADEEFLIVPQRSASREAFDGAVDAAALVRASGIANVLDGETGERRLSELLADAPKTATLLAADSYIEHYGMYTNPARAHLLKRLEEIRPGLELIDIRPLLAGLRMIKRPIELEAIQQAIDITIEGLRYISAAKRLAAYAHEYEPEADLTREFRRRGAAGHAFAPILASGKRGCTLHNVANSGEMQAGDLIVMDVGAEYGHYAADITRTYAIGEPSVRQQEIHQAVLDVQAYALTLLKPGIMLKEYEAQVEEYMGAKLQGLGLITTVSHEEIRRFYPHATSHFMGLDVHDVGEYDQPLKPGTVLTCEPGIYVPEEGIGVRIEDDVLITEDGNRVLSADLPREL